MLILAIKDSRQWLMSLVCSDPAKASGACHRSLQLIHLLQSDGWQLEQIDPPLLPQNSWRTLRLGATAALRHGPMQPFGVASLRSQGHCDHQVAELHRRFPSLNGVIQEGTGYGSLSAVAEWCRLGVRTVLVPANIESLAPNTDSWTHRNLDISQRFDNERRWWAMVDKVFTISIEEAWWLQLHGIGAEHLPYYPPPQRAQLLRSIRDQRKPDQAVGWLWVADFRNPANQVGALLTFKWLADCQSPPRQVLIVGRDFEWLKDTYADQVPLITRLLGEVSDSELDQLCKTCTAQLVVHPATSGMLTRVVDAAVAGIPVVGNTMALKSYAYCFATQGVVTEPHRSREAEALFLQQLAH